MRPGANCKETPATERQSPKRLLKLRASRWRPIQLIDFLEYVVVWHFDLARNYSSADGVQLCLEWRDDFFIVAIDRIVDAIVLESEVPRPRLKTSAILRFDNVEDGGVHALEHARGNTARLQTILIAIASN